MDNTKTLNEFRFFRMKKGYEYIGIRRKNLTFEGIGKHYCSIGLWWYEVQCFNSLKA
jgi:hypothetical protein